VVLVENEKLAVGEEMVGNAGVILHVCEVGVSSKRRRWLPSFAKE
jgi:hypothetical protein